MLFNSAEFLLFFTLVFGLYFQSSHSQKLKLLLVSSYFFYMFWIPYYGILILFSTVVDYFCVLAMEKRPQKKRFYLFISLFSNLGLLFFFKYLLFATHSLEFLLQTFAEIFSGSTSDIQLPLLKLILPVGISFYTFQTLSYTIDVYKGKRKAEKDFWIFALYVSFFPQLVAGPIERSTRLIPQFHEPKVFDYNRVADGLKLMMWGFFKKIVIADRVALYVNQVYEAPWEYEGLTFLVATYFFAVQIYCDFSGYSDIAIGTAKVLGFDLMENFDRPYLARSIPEFWRRWHISLSTWFRDYVYIPLGGNRVQKGRLYFNISFVFLVSGLWHGANYTFLVWGALHGAYQCVSLWTKSWRKRIREYLKITENNFFLILFQMVLTFHLVCFAWIFFRANHIGEAYYVIEEIFTFSFNLQEILAPIGKIEFFYTGVALIALLLIEIVQYQGIIIRNKIACFPLVVRWSIYIMVPTITLMFGIFEKQEFLYFQF